jgi:hypothetical protein
MTEHEKQAMTAAVQKLDAMIDGDDEASSHEVAEEILCDLLRKAGFGEVSDAFVNASRRVDFWYS